MKTFDLQRTSLLLAMLMALVLVACAAPEPSVGGDEVQAATSEPAEPTDVPATPVVDTIENQLVGTNWKLESMNGVDINDIDMTLNFSDDMISGSDGCNTFNGGYSIENGMLSIDENLALTAMACPDVDDEMSQQYLDALVSAGELTLSGDDLIIQTANGALIFGRDDDADSMTDPAVDTIENQIVDTNWKLESIDGVEATDDMTLSFGAGTISGSDGCNTFNGEYTIENGMLVIGDNMAVTAMACPDMDGAMAQQYLDALMSAGEFTLDGDDLTIQTDNGALVFEREEDMGGNAGIDTMVNPLVMTNWELISINGTEVDGGMTLRFGPEVISGSDGCNTFSADYTINSSGTLNISDNIASTMIACPDMDDEMAQQYLNALVGATSFMHDGDSLTIQTASGDLVFTQMANAELDGTRWQLDSLADSSSITRMPIDSNIFVMFDGAQVNGNGGCNSFSGNVTTDAVTMKFGNIVATLMACADEGVNQRETEFFAALENVASYEIIGQMLTMYNGEGGTVATFVATDAEMMESAELQNIVWQWVRFEDTADQNNIDVDDPASYTIQFMDDGSYALQADCNSGNGNYTDEGGSLTIEAGAMTLAECGDESLGETFVQQLGDVTTFVFDGNGNLVLNLKLDVGNMVFTAAQ